MPAAPFEELEIVGDTYTVSENCSKLVIYTGNKFVIPAFNENIGSSDRCTSSTTPCGGVKNSPVPDMFPGTLSISGESCYLKNIAGTYTGKHLSSGQLSENAEVITSGVNGCAFRTADGKLFLTADSKKYLVTPLNTIVSKACILNISDSSHDCIITIRCPDDVSSISLYNLDSCAYEDVSFTNVQQSFGAVNSYTFTQTVEARSTKRIQVMVNYSGLSCTYKFSNDAFSATGLHNMVSFLAYYDTTDTDINFILFTKTPEYITCTQDSAGNVTQFTFPKGTGAIYHGRKAHAALTRITSGEVPDCLNPSVFCSLSQFLAGSKAISDVSDVSITSYVVPTMTDEKILPRTTVSESYISSTISKRMSPDEYSCASFVIKANKAVNLSIIASDLTSGSNTISRDNINLKYVKCWWQDGNSKKSTHNLGCYLTPELLINDDSLIQVWGERWDQLNVPNPAGRNFIKLNTGEYVDISERIIPDGPDSILTPNSEMPIYDADYLQPVNLLGNDNKQVWITLHPPAGTPAGTYTGSITIRSGFTILKTITLSVVVVPITLLPSTKEISIYYRGKLADEGTISSEYKNVEQFTAEHLDMVHHGVTNPVLMTHTETTLPIALGIRTQCGISNAKLYHYSTLNIDDSIADITNWRDVCTSNGVGQLYIYGHDESSLDTTELRTKMAAIHDVGVKIFCAQSPTQAISVNDILDLAIGNSTCSAEDITEFQTYGNKIYSYANPQTIPEFPLTYRRNYGLFLWQIGYDGAMPYAYQHSFKFIWNDFDSTYHRDHALAYPTANGVIDTVQWEGFREGVNDLKYLATLQAAIIAHPGTTATTANSWLTTLKSTDLSTLDMDEVREQMIDYILALQEA